MFDRTDFWPPAPDWTASRFQTESLTITATCNNTPAFLLSGNTKAIEALAAAFLKPPGARLLRFAPDRFLLISTAATDLDEGWHKQGVAVSAVDGLYVCMDIRGPDAMALLRSGSMSIAMMNAPLSPAALSFAGITVLFEPLADGARLYVEHPQAAYLWQWIEASVSRKDQ